MEKIIFKFTIKGKLPSLNDYTLANRNNRYCGNNFKKKVERRILKSISTPKWVECYPAMLKIKWYEPNKRRDIDNIVFATKFILDALVKAEVLEDDNQKCIDKLEHEVLIDKENPRIEVEIVERVK